MSRKYYVTNYSISNCEKLTNICANFRKYIFRYFHPNLITVLQKTSFYTSFEKESEICCLMETLPRVEKSLILATNSILSFPQVNLASSQYSLGMYVHCIHTYNVHSLHRALQDKGNNLYDEGEYSEDLMGCLPHAKNHVQ